jgi:hypothetical protein
MNGTYEWHTGEVPEDNHEAPPRQVESQSIACELSVGHVLFMEHVPGLGDAFLTLGTRIDVEPSSKDHERQVLSDEKRSAGDWTGSAEKNAQE